MKRAIARAVRAMATATATRVLGDKVGKGSKALARDKNGGQAIALVRASASKRVTMTALAVALEEEDNGKSRKSNGCITLAGGARGNCLTT